jgi:hypothetical protein
VVILGALVACHHPLTPRERALALLPAEATIVAAADGPALATWRRAVDEARPYVPPSFGCVIDAALASDAIAVAQREAGTTVVIVTRAAVTGCPTLARIAGDTYVATIGDATTEHGLGSGWSRARPYLEKAPIALAAQILHRDWLAEADATGVVVTIDAKDAALVEPIIRLALAKLPKLSVTRTGTQIVVRAKGLSIDEIVAMTSALLAKIDHPGTPAAAAFACPSPGGVIASCTGGTHLVVGSLGDALTQLTDTAKEPVISGGEVIGLRLTADALVLHRGDVILGIDAHRVTSAAQLAAVIGSVGKQVSVAVRRGSSDVVVDLRARD